MSATVEVTVTDSVSPTQVAGTAPLGRHELTMAVMLASLAFLVLVTLQALVFRTLPTGTSYAPHFVYQADAFLHGRWNVTLGKDVTDVVSIAGKQFIVNPPMPAILMMPFVAVWGLRFSDILFTTVIASLNMGLLYLLLEQVRACGFSKRSERANLLLAVFFVFGTINVWLSTGGQMWFTAQVVWLLFTLLALLVSFRGHFIWGAFFIACAFFCRATAISGFVVVGYLAWQNVSREQLVERFATSLRARRPDWSAIPWRRLRGPLVVGVATLLLYMLRNALVFANPFESGYNIQILQRHPEVTTGAFNLSYIPSNIVANFLTFPSVTFTGPFDRHPIINMVGNGVATGLFFTTPLFLYLFWRNRRFSMMRAALWVTLGLVLLEVLTFHAAGYYQFGARYLFDGYPFAFLLLAMAEFKLDWRVLLLGTLGIVACVLGAQQFWTFSVFVL